jgi:site-specific DNA-methyltransferase (adenine-specific)
VDGVIIYHTSRQEYARAIVSVKGGKHVNPGMIRDLNGVLHREKAEAGIFICLDAPSKEMRNEAHLAGRVQLPGGDRPKIQIITVGELIEAPDLGIPTVLDTIGAAQAARSEVRRQQKAKKKPTPADLRREPPLPPMPITGGRKGKKDQVPLALDEPVLVPPQRKRTRRTA